MSFTDAIRKCFQNYVGFSGRAARSEYWWWFLFVLVGNLLFGALDGMLFGAGAEGGVGILGAIFGLATLLPSIAVAVRRLHDRDMSGWWVLLALIPLIGFLILLFFYVQKGTDGQNRFGPDPLGPGGGDGDMTARTSIPRAGQ